MTHADSADGRRPPAAVPPTAVLRPESREEWCPRRAPLAHRAPDGRWAGYPASPPPPPAPPAPERRRWRLAASLASLAAAAVVLVLVAVLSPDLFTDGPPGDWRAVGDPAEGPAAEQSRVEAGDGRGAQALEGAVGQRRVDAGAPQGGQAAAAPGSESAAELEAFGQTYPAPPVAEEPVVAVAETVAPSVVRIEIASNAGFGVGSGIVWDADNGYIVTNQHVVEGVDDVIVTLSDGTHLDGEVVGGSSGHDVAVIRVAPEAAELVAAVFAPTSSVRVGQLAVAIGSPHGLSGTVTAGIVSAIRIQPRGGADPVSPVPTRMIQTDAAVNRGNSGGALADWQGRVIGMNTLIQTTTAWGGSIGLGFAVPSDTIELIAERIVTGQSLELGYLGISSRAGRDDVVGVTIGEVVPGSPADEAGLRVDDVILSLDGEEMHSIEELAAAVKLRTPGETVDLMIERDGERYVAPVVLGAWS